MLMFKEQFLKAFLGFKGRFSKATAAVTAPEIAQVSAPENLAWFAVKWFDIGILLGGIVIAALLSLKAQNKSQECRPPSMIYIDDPEICDEDDDPMLARTLEEDEPTLLTQPVHIDARNPRRAHRRLKSMSSRQNNARRRRNR